MVLALQVQFLDCMQVMIILVFEHFIRPFSMTLPFISGVLLCCLYSAFVVAQPALYTVVGLVKERGSKSALEYANVALYAAADSSLVTGTITDRSGKFALQVKKNAPYYLQVHFLGYKKQTVDSIKLKEWQVFDAGVIYLAPDDISIAEVGVVAEKPMMRYEVDRKVVDVSRNPMAQGGTAVEALENVPSVSVDMEGSVTLRGSSNFTVLIDGRQSPLSGSDALNQIPASAIAQIEIVTNPSAKYDPDGPGGIINIVTKKGRLKGHSVVANLSVGNSPKKSADFAYTYRYKKFAWMLNSAFNDSDIRFFHTDEQYSMMYDSVYENNYQSDLITDKNGFMQHDRLTLGTGFDLFLSENHSVNLSASYNSFRFGREFISDIQKIDYYSVLSPSLADSLSFEQSKNGFDVKPQRLQVSIGDHYLFKGNSKHYFSVDVMYQSGNEKRNDYVSKYSGLENEGMLTDEKAVTSEGSEEFRAECNYAQPVSEMLSFEAGLTFRRNSYVQNYKRFGLLDNGGWGEMPRFSDQADFQRDVYAGWALAKGKLRYFQYSFGLRLEQTDRKIVTEKDSWNFAYNYLGWYPSFSLMREWKKGHSLQASYSKRLNRPRDHHMNPFPGLSDGYFKYMPNPELRPEIAASFELNYQKKWGQNFVSAEAFYRSVTDEIDRVTEIWDDTLVRAVINIGRVDDAGLEAAANFKLLKWWGWNLNASASYHRISDDERDSLSANESFQFNSSATSTFDILKKYKLQVLFFYRGPRDEIDASRKAMFWVSAALRRDFFDRKLTLALRGDDLFASRKREEHAVSGNTKIVRYGHRKSPLLFMSVSYKFNSASDRKRERQSAGGDDGGMMDF